MPVKQRARGSSENSRTKTQRTPYTSTLWIKDLQNLCISVSMTGKGRCNDNANIERLWRSLKYEGSYLYGWNSVRTLKDNISKWLQWYNYKRPHQTLKYKVPFDLYRGFVDKFYNLSTIPQYQQLQDLFL